ncbi:hypothetical protein Csa_023625, partial [Cucumis sativus]
IVSYANNNQLGNAFASVKTGANAGLATKASNNVIVVMSNTVNASLVMAATLLAATISYIVIAINGDNVPQADDMNHAENEDATLKMC